MIVRTLASAVTDRNAYISAHDVTPLAPALDIELSQYQREVCTAYLSAPENDDAALASYDAFITELLAQWRYVTASVHVQFCDEDPTPMVNGVPSYKALVREVEETNVLRVYRSGENDHSVLCARTIEHDGRIENLNSIFRAVHDYFGHLASGGHFGWSGETTAYYSHAAMFSIDARTALFTETVGQQSYYAVYRDYAPQRVVALSSAYHSAPLS